MKPAQRNILILLLVLTNISISWDRTRNTVSYRIAAGSRLWIEGIATLGSYKCETVAVYGMGDIDTNSYAEKTSSHETNKTGESAHLDVIVRFFDCGNPAMNADMYAALKADKDSIIHYKLIKTSIIYDSSNVNGRVGIRTIGKLIIAGISKLDTIDADIRVLQDKKYEIIGRKNLSMIDFDINPPTAFLGLIKAYENLTINFDLIAVPYDEKSLDKMGAIIEKF